MKEYQPWEVWGRRPDVEGTLVRRAKGELPEMESTKQLVKLVGAVYEPGMKVLDVGCNTGHYLRGLRRLDQKLDYTGVDAYEFYINQAKDVYKNDANAKFQVKSILEPLFQEEFDIVYCCNVLMHLPYFEIPVKHLIESSKKFVFIRTLLGEYTTISKRLNKHEFDKDGNPTDVTYQNTYETNTFLNYIRNMGCKAELIDDEFDPAVIASEYNSLKKNQGTRIVNGIQADGAVIFNWKFVKVTKL